MEKKSNNTLRLRGRLLPSQLEIHALMFVSLQELVCGLRCTSRDNNVLVSRFLTKAKSLNFRADNRHWSFLAMLLDVLPLFRCVETIDFQLPRFRTLESKQYSHRIERIKLAIVDLVRANQRTISSFELGCFNSELDLLSSLALCPNLTKFELEAFSFDWVRSATVSQIADLVVQLLRHCLKLRFLSLPRRIFPLHLLQFIVNNGIFRSVPRFT